MATKAKKTKGDESSEPKVGDVIFEPIEEEVKTPKKSKVDKTPVTGIRVKGGKRYKKYRIATGDVVSFVNEYID